MRKTRGFALSGGERRRVEIARCLAIEPAYILLDEPFSGIDPIAVLDLQEIIFALKASGIGVLITDHNVRETLSVTDRAYIINGGEDLSRRARRGAGAGPGGQEGLPGGEVFDGLRAIPSGASEDGVLESILDRRRLRMTERYLTVAIDEDGEGHLAEAVAIADGVRTDSDGVMHAPTGHERAGYALRLYRRTYRGRRGIDLVRGDTCSQSLTYQGSSVLHPPQLVAQKSK